MTITTPALAQPSDWLTENGPGELEALFRAIVFHPSVPILIAGNDCTYRDASVGAARLLGVPRHQIIGRNIDDFVDPAFKPKIPELWRAFLSKGDDQGTIQLATAAGATQEAEYTARGNVLPSAHVLVFRGKGTSPNAGVSGEPVADTTPRWAQDYAMFLLDTKGRVAGWYSGAERIYGYTAKEAIGQHLSFVSPGENARAHRPEHELERSIAQSHFGSEGWHTRKDGSRFWANAITMSLRNASGELQGFARAVRDFTRRHDADEQLRSSRAYTTPVSKASTIAGVVLGEFDRVPESNDAFLELVGYSREDLLEGRLQWPDLTPPEYSALDELAHEEGLQFGACTPYEKELLRKDGTRIPVLISTAVLKISPFRWITFVQDLRGRESFEAVGDEDVEGRQDFEEIIGSSVSLKRMLRQVEVVAPTDATVLILGETGTGKELVARAVHRLSPRKHLPFITLNCAAIPTGLLESELFGYEKGAFTGALTQKMGRFELAHRGTLFLDEVGDIPVDLQPKLLRALQEKSFERLGGTRTIPIDVRLVAATNRNLPEMVGDKLFRSDLYYRLKVFPITTLPLRDHPEDIPLLVRHFTQKYARSMNKQIDKISSDTMNGLVAWSWPGNVRELENFIERSVILSRGASLHAPLAELRTNESHSGAAGTLEQVEREHIIRVLRESGGVISKAATRLGVPRTTLNALMRKLGITRTSS